MNREAEIEPQRHFKRANLINIRSSGLQSEGAAF